VGLTDYIERKKLIFFFILGRTKIGKLQRKNRREESQKQGKMLCYCLQEVGVVQGKKGLLFRCAQITKCPFKRRADCDINA